MDDLSPPSWQVPKQWKGPKQFGVFVWGVGGWVGERVYMIRVWSCACVSVRMLSLRQNTPPLMERIGIAAT
jgi:hypothetical protein